MTQQKLNEFDTTVSCPSCDRDSFNDERAMRIHHKQAHGESLVGQEERYRCPICDREVQTKQGVNNHLSKVHPDTWADLCEEDCVWTLADRQ
jgi:endogenous inhibitor of DNA gyrase (YacG/DUF329 family)